MKIRKRINLLAILVLITNLCFSQTSVKDSVGLNEVVVTGSKIEISRKLVPLSVSQISQKDIENSVQINILPALNSYSPSVFVTERNILGFGVSTGGAGSVTIRGISGSPDNEILVLIDGHPQYQGIFGHPLPDAYVASDVEKVEIIRGPASILYGSNAMGGVINIITKRQKDDGLNLNFGASYGSYNTRKFYGTLGYKKDKLSLFASLNHDQTDGLRDSTGFNITNGYAKVGYELSKYFDLTADFCIAKFNADDNGTIYQPAFLNIDITRGKTSLSIDNKFDKSEGSLKFYHNFGTHDLSDGFHSTDRNSGIMLCQTFKLASATNITIGSDFKQYGGTANSGFKHDSLMTVNELAVYTYAQQTLIEKLAVSAGLRLENNSKFGNELVPMGGLTYSLTNQTSFKASVAKGFRSPTIMEMYLYAPNPDLKPERLVNYEISWLQSFHDNCLNFELTAYKANGSNRIQVVGQYPNIIRQNVGSFSNWGIEFSARYVVNKNLYFNANYSYLDMDNVVIAAPRQQMNMGVDHSYKIWSLHLSAQYINKLYTNIAPAITQNYTLVNARLFCRPLKHLELFVSSNNLLDQRYQINYGYPMPGINFNGGVNYKL
jgi:outer membrane receptor protein involved in Fe transport